jgi:hypothetical protein
MRLLRPTRFDMALPDRLPDRLRLIVSIGMIWLPESPVAHTRAVRGRRDSHRSLRGLERDDKETQLQKAIMDSIHASGYAGRKGTLCARSSQMARHNISVA